MASILKNTGQSRTGNQAQTEGGLMFYCRPQAAVLPRRCRFVPTLPFGPVSWVRPASANGQAIGSGAELHFSTKTEGGEGDTGGGPGDTLPPPQHPAYFFEEGATLLHPQHRRNATMKKVSIRLVISTVCAMALTFGGAYVILSQVVFAETVSPLPG